MTPAIVHPRGVVPQGLVDEMVARRGGRPSSEVVALLSEPLPGGGAS
jgi:hypothetical protein